MARYALRRVGVLDKTTDNEITRLDSIQWRLYQEWLAAGNTPDPMPIVDDTPTQAELAALAEIANRDTMRATLVADNTVQFLRTHTPLEAAAWIQANVNDLATAKNVLAKIGMVVAYLARERLQRD
jgi:hypothetical protein